MALPGRSQGDGMESIPNHTDTLIPPVSSCNLEIKNGFNKTKSFSGSWGGLKEPKFVPYEPYKGAVNFIVPKAKKSRLSRVSYRPLPSDLVEKVDLYKLSPLLSKEDFVVDDILKPSSVQWDEEKLQMTKEMQELKEEKHSLEKQLNVQLEVNNELKKLLVASVGEDMNDRIAFLTEDKVKLADVITQYDSNLRNNNEEAENIAIESDVWRSKFLASSMIVKDLAVFKAVLTQRNNDYKNIIGDLLDFHKTLFLGLNGVLRGLRAISSVFSPPTTKPTMTNSEEGRTLSAICKTLTKEVRNLGSLLLGSSSSVTAAMEMKDGHNHCVLSEIEDRALKLMNAPLDTDTSLPSCSCSSKWWDEAVIQQQLTQLKVTSFNCCPNCEGDIINV